MIASLSEARKILVDRLFATGCEGMGNGRGGDETRQTISFQEVHRSGRQEASGAAIRRTS
jgi:hypothetical protein